MWEMGNSACMGTYKRQLILFTKASETAMAVNGEVSVETTVGIAKGRELTLSHHMTIEGIACVISGRHL